MADETETWEDLGLDDRLLKAVAACGFDAPTLVQAKCIPLTLAGKDVLVKARTGYPCAACSRGSTAQGRLASRELPALCRIPPGGIVGGLLA